MICRWRGSRRWFARRAPNSVCALRRSAAFRPRLRYGASTSTPNCFSLAIRARLRQAGPAIAPASNADTTATAAVTCTNTTPYLVAVAGGTLGAGGFTYDIYSNSGRTTLFPVSGGTKTLTGTGSAQTVTMYGRIVLPQGSVVPNSYSTTTAVLVEW